MRTNYRVSSRLGRWQRLRRRIWIGREPTYSFVGMYVEALTIRRFDDDVVIVVRSAGHDVELLRAALVDGEEIRVDTITSTWGR